MSRPKFDVFTACVSELQQALDSGELTSLGLTSAYLDQIAQHNVAGFGLRAVIDVAPRASVQAHARQLDNERTIQGARRPLHGIPILIKVGARRLQNVADENAHWTTRTASTRTHLLAWARHVGLWRCGKQSQRRTQPSSIW
jgi:hypothetical protein